DRSAREDRGMSQINRASDLSTREQHARSASSPQPKSDISDFGQLKAPNSGKPEFGGGEGWGEGVTGPRIVTPSPPPSPHSASETRVDALMVGRGSPTELASPSSTKIRTPVASNTRLGAALRHARYILSENAVTGFAFALFLVIVLAALIGPYIVPYDPLASDTVAALKGPSVAHWFGTDQLGRDVFSRVIVATRLDFFIAIASVA